MKVPAEEGTGGD